MYRLLFLQPIVIYIVAAYQTDSKVWYCNNADLTKSFFQTTKRPQTAGTLFKNSMVALVKTLTSKEPFYVRCIKPNEDKSPNTLNEERVVHQVRYLGLLENIRVRRAGFAHRQRYDRFLKRWNFFVCLKVCIFFLGFQKVREHLEFYWIKRGKKYCNSLSYLFWVKKSTILFWFPSERLQWGGGWEGGGGKICCKCFYLLLPNKLLLLVLCK